MMEICNLTLQSLNGNQQVGIVKLYLDFLTTKIPTRDENGYTSKINTTASFYSWIYNRYSWISIHGTHQYFLRIVSFTHSVGGIIDGNET